MKYHVVDIVSLFWLIFGGSFQKKNNQYFTNNLSFTFDSKYKFNNTCADNESVLIVISQKATTIESNRYKWD